jgi:hypothetical protein
VTIHVQTPGNAYILVANLAPPFDPLKQYIAGDPSVWVRDPSIFLYNNAPSISNIRPNYARCTRSPILLAPGSSQSFTHTCDASDVNVNGCGYELRTGSSGVTTFCSFFGNSIALDGTKVQNAPYSQGQATSNQQIKCTSPKGTDELRSDCAHLRNSSFVIGPRNFGIAAAVLSNPPPKLCQLESASWFPLEGDSQVKFTFYDDPAQLNLSATSNETESRSMPGYPLKALRVSSPSQRAAFSFLFFFLHD